jgi:NADH-quinone oxidoreductase subunit N
MNPSLMSLELAVVILALGILLGDLWTPVAQKRMLGYVAAAGVAAILIFSFATHSAGVLSVGAKPEFAFGHMFVVDKLALFFKQFFMIAAILVLFMAVEYSGRIAAGISEFYSLILFALAGMMFAASANDLMLMFVSLELITITFYILTSFRRGQIISLEAGIKYLILGALSTGFVVFGIALVFGTATTTNFTELQALLSSKNDFANQPLFLLGLLLIVAGLGFKIAAFPFQIWAPDVYEGSPAPTTAFLAVGSKAAGIVLLLRLLFDAVPQVTVQWRELLMVISGVTILYGNLCAIPQRSIKRLMGYSSIAHAGYLLLGFAALNGAGSSAILFYLAGYLFSVIAAFTVIALIMQHVDSDDITVVAGLNRRSPFLAASLTFAMVSLAGIPPLAGFFGKFLLVKAAIEQGAMNPGYYVLIGITIVGVVISLYYYFGIVRAIYWGQESVDLSQISVSFPAKASLIVCMAGMLFLGIFPDPVVKTTTQAAEVLQLTRELPQVAQRVSH